MKIEQIPVGYMQVFCYLVYDEETNEGILIDPAGNEEALVEHLRDKGIKLRYIVNTHGHADHTCGNEPIKKATGAGVVMHATDDLFYQKPESKMFAKSMGFPASDPADVRRAGRRRAFVRQSEDEIHSHSRAYAGRMLHIDRWKPLYRGHPVCGSGWAHRPARRIVQTVDSIAPEPCENAPAGYRGVAGPRLRGPAPIHSAA